MLLSWQILCCSAKPGKNDARGRKALLLYVCVGGCLASFPGFISSAPCNTPTWDQMWTKIEKKTLRWNKMWTKESRFGCCTDITIRLTYTGSWLSGHLRPSLLITSVMIFISPCSSPHRADICEHKPSVSEFTQLRIKLPKVNKFSVCFFLKCQLCSSTG